jgi:hypothetical protein
MPKKQRDLVSEIIKMTPKSSKKKRRNKALATRWDALDSPEAVKRFNNHIRNNPQDKPALLKQVLKKARYVRNDVLVLFPGNRVRCVLDLAEKHSLTDEDLSKLFNDLGERRQTEFFFKCLGGVSHGIERINAILPATLASYCLGVVSEQGELLQKIYHQYTRKKDFLKALLSVFVSNNVDQDARSTARDLSLEETRAIRAKQRISNIKLRHLVGCSTESVYPAFANLSPKNQAAILLGMDKEDAELVASLYQSQVAMQPVDLLEAVYREALENQGDPQKVVSLLFSTHWRLSGDSVLAFYKSFSADLQYHLLETAETPQQRVKLALKMTSGARDDFGKRFNKRMAFKTACILLGYYPKLIESLSAQQIRDSLASPSAEWVQYLFDCLGAPWFVLYLSCGFPVKYEAYKARAQAICGLLNDAATCAMRSYLRFAGSDFEKYFVFLKDAEKRGGAKKAGKVVTQKTSVPTSVFPVEPSAPPFSESAAFDENQNVSERLVDCSRNNQIVAIFMKMMKATTLVPEDIAELFAGFQLDRQTDFLFACWCLKNLRKAEYINDITPELLVLYCLSVVSTHGRFIQVIYQQYQDKKGFSRYLFDRLTKGAIKQRIASIRLFNLVEWTDYSGSEILKALLCTVEEAKHFLPEISALFDSLQEVQQTEFLDACLKLNNEQASLGKSYINAILCSTLLDYCLGVISMQDSPVQAIYKLYWFKEDFRYQLLSRLHLGRIEQRISALKLFNLLECSNGFVRAEFEGIHAFLFEEQAALLVLSEIPGLFCYFNEDQQTSFLVTCVSQAARGKHYINAIALDALVSCCLKVVSQQAWLVQGVYHLCQETNAFIDQLLDRFITDDVNKRIASIQLLTLIQWPGASVGAVRDIFAKFFLEEKVLLLVGMVMKDMPFAVKLYRSQVFQHPVDLLEKVYNQLLKSNKEKLSIVSRWFSTRWDMSGYVSAIRHYKNFSPDLQYYLLETIESAQRRTELVLGMSKTALTAFKEKLNESIKFEEASIVLSSHLGLMLTLSVPQKKRFLRVIEAKQVQDLLDCLSVQWFVLYLSTTFKADIEEDKMLAQTICSFLDKDARSLMKDHLKTLGPSGVEYFVFLKMDTLLSPKKRLVAMSRNRRASREPGFGVKSQKHSNGGEGSPERFQGIVNPYDNSSPSLFLTPNQKNMSEHSGSRGERPPPQTPASYRDFSGASNAVISPVPKLKFSP